MEKNQLVVFYNLGSIREQIATLYCSLSKALMDEKIIKPTLEEIKDTLENVIDIFDDVIQYLPNERESI